MGLDEEYFVSKDAVSPDLRCPICHEIFDDPVSSSGGQCECLFCRACLTEAVKRNGVCPLDRRPIQLKNVVANRLARNLIDALPVFCLHRGSGCSWSGRFDQRAAHEEKCMARRLEALEADLRRTQTMEQEARRADIEELKADLRHKQATESAQRDAIEELFRMSAMREQEMQKQVEALQSLVAAQQGKIQDLEFQVGALRGTVRMSRTKVRRPTWPEELKGRATWPESSSSSGQALPGGEPVFELGPLPEAKGEEANDVPTSPRGSSSSSSSALAPFASNAISGGAEGEFRIAGDHVAACVQLRAVRKLPATLSPSDLRLRAWVQVRDACRRSGLEGKVWDQLRERMEQRQASWEAAWPIYAYTSTGFNYSSEALQKPGPSEESGSKSINEVLRDGKYVRLQHYLELLQQTLESDEQACRTPYTTVWRGMSVSKGAFANLPRYFPQDQVVAFLGLTSTSGDATMAERYMAETWKKRLWIRIDVPSEAPYVYSVEHLTIWPEEKEVLLMPLVKMRVVGFRFVDSRRAEVHLCIVGPSPLFA